MGTGLCDQARRTFGPWRSRACSIRPGATGGVEHPAGGDGDVEPILAVSMDAASVEAYFRPRDGLRGMQEYGNRRARDAPGAVLFRMLLTREEMSYNFGGARLDPVRDRELLVWTFSQFLYGEVTGIHVGRWIERAPDLEAAAFFAHQASDDFSHVRVFLEILGILGARPVPPHRLIRFVATDLAGRTFEEHVAIEMAQGEGLVLSAIYALADTVDHPKIRGLLEETAEREEHHVAFGEERTLRAIESRPRLVRHLLGLALVGIAAVARLARPLESFACSGGLAEDATAARRGWSGRWWSPSKPLPGASALVAAHPMLSQLEGFHRTALSAAELRLQRLGLLDRQLVAVSRTEKLRLMAGSLTRSTATFPFRRARRLTRTYLNDPVVRETIAGKEA